MNLSDFIESVIYSQENILDENFIQGIEVFSNNIIKAIEEFNSLRARDKYTFLLRLVDTYPLGLLILYKLMDYSLQIHDENVRYKLLEIMQKNFEHIKDRIKSCNDDNGLLGILSEKYSLLEEFMNLKKNAIDRGTSLELEEMKELEKELNKIELNLNVIENYQMDNRKTYLEDLQKDISFKKTIKDELEGSIREKKNIKELKGREIKEREENIKVLTNEIERNETIWNEEEIKEEEEKIKTEEKDIVKIRSEKETARKEIETLSLKKSKIEAELVNLKQELSELNSLSSESKVKTLISLLPEDAIDKKLKSDIKKLNR